MIKYTTVGTNDLQRAGAFYDALLEGLGAKRVVELERMIGWSVGTESPIFSVIKPFDGQTANHGNGAMIALNVEDTNQIDRLHRKALDLGGKDEGAPGIRFGTFYAAYVRDLDGNKVAFVRM